MLLFCELLLDVLLSTTTVVSSIVSSISGEVDVVSTFKLWLESELSEQEPRHRKKYK